MNPLKLFAPLLMFHHTSNYLHKIKLKYLWEALDKVPTANLGLTSSVKFCCFLYMSCYLWHCQQLDFELAKTALYVHYDASPFNAQTLIAMCPFLKQLTFVSIRLLFCFAVKSLKWFSIFPWRTAAPRSFSAKDRFRPLTTICSFLLK